jgi:hypothetical protein
VAVEAEGRRFKSRGPLVYVPAGKHQHQLVAEDLMEDGTISLISNAYSLRQGRRLLTTSEAEEWQFVFVIGEETLEKL